MAASPPPSGSTIVVGVIPDQPDDVLVQAARFAERFGAELVCASVDQTRYTVEELADGSVSAFPIDPDQAELVTEEFDPELALHIKQILTPMGVSWSLRALAGETAHELARLAEELNAEFIVVGTRHVGVRAGAREFFSGSAAVHLAHRQHRPVIVVPLAPVAHGTKLPWE